MSAPGHFAFVFGSNGPRSSQAQLRYARSDAERIGQALAGPRGGFSVNELQHRPDTANAVMQQLRAFLSERLPDDRVIVYFSGHGILEDGELVLLWDDTTFKNLPGTALRISDITHAMAYSRARQKLLILDCCHAGGIIQEEAFKDGGEGVRVESVASSKLKQTIVLAASDHLQRAREVELLGGSFLASCVCDALGDSFQHIKKARPTELTIEELRDWIRTRSAAFNKKYKSADVPDVFTFGKTYGSYVVAREPSWARHIVRGPFDIPMTVLPLRLGDRALLIGVTPVTNAQYRLAVDDGAALEPCGEHFCLPDYPYLEGDRRLFKRPTSAPDGRAWRGTFRPWGDPAFADPSKPVVCISLEAASRYCKFLSARSKALRFALPSLQLWSIAAAEEPLPRVDILELSDPRILFARPDDAIRNCHHMAMAPANCDRDSAPASPTGALDLIGNVWEWCGFLSPRNYDTQLVRLAASDSDSRVPPYDVVGGGFLDDLARIRWRVRGAELRENGGEHLSHSDLGFRVAASLPLTDLAPEVSSRIKLCPDAGLLGIPSRAPYFL